MVAAAVAAAVHLPPWRVAEVAAAEAHLPPWQGEAAEAVAAAARPLPSLVQEAAAAAAAVLRHLLPWTVLQDEQEAVAVDHGGLRWVGKAQAAAHEPRSWQAVVVQMVGHGRWPLAGLGVAAAHLLLVRDEGR